MSADLSWSNPAGKLDDVLVRRLAEVVQQHVEDEDAVSAISSVRAAGEARWRLRSAHRKTPWKTPWKRLTRTKHPLVPFRLPSVTHPSRGDRDRPHPAPLSPCPIPQHDLPRLPRRGGGRTTYP